MNNINITTSRNVISAERLHLQGEFAKLSELERNTTAGVYIRLAIDNLHHVHTLLQGAAERSSEVL